MKIQIADRQRIVAALPALTIEEARAQLRVDTYGSPPANDEDDLISALVEAATQELDVSTGWLGRALGPQTWLITFDRFPGGACPLRVPYPPFLQIVDFAYTDPDGNVIDMVAEGLFTTSINDDRAFLRPLVGSNWPTSLSLSPAAVSLQFRCGYSDGASPEGAAVPQIIKSWIKGRLTELYDNRGVNQGANGRGQLPDSAFNSLNMVRVWDNDL